MTSIEDVLQSLLSDKSVAEALSEKLGKHDNNTNDVKETMPSNPKFEQKINLIKAIIPMLDEKTSENAKFLIKLLSLISVIEELQQSQ